MPKKPRALKFSSFNVENLGKFLFEARKSKGINRSDFAKSLGVSRSSLTMWESGLRVPDADAIAGICAQLGLDANQLLGLNSVHATDAVRKRIARLILAEGAEALASSVGLDGRTINRILEDDFFGLTTKGIRAIASDYRLSVEWLLTGDPKHWAQSLQGEVPERIRFFRICHGISPSLAKGIDVSQNENRQEIKAKGKSIASLDGLLVALQALHGRSPDFPFSLNWIATGKVDTDTTEPNPAGPGSKLG